MCVASAQILIMTLIILIMHSFVAETGNFETSDSAALGEYETAASVPICLVQTVKVGMLMGQQAYRTPSCLCGPTRATSLMAGRPVTYCCYSWIYLMTLPVFKLLLNNNRTISEQWTWKDVEGSGCALISGTIHAFLWRDWGKSWRLLGRLGGLHLEVWTRD